MSPLAPPVLLVEDELQMRRFLRTALTAREYQVVETATLQEARQAITSNPTELVLLDLGLPDGDGIEFIKEVREWSQIPIIVISARGREDDRVVALDTGADDYLTKPFGIHELMARIRVALRHARMHKAGMQPETALHIGALCVNPARREVHLDGEPLSLTPIEYRLLLYLASHAGRVLTHRQILQEIWGPNHMGRTHTLRVFMAKLRHKLEADPSHPRLLMTETGVGYRMRDLPG